MQKLWLFTDLGELNVTLIAAWSIHFDTFQRYLVVQTFEKIALKMHTWTRHLIQFS